VINSITSDRPEYLEGETITVTIDATNGTYPISHYFLLCEIEGTIVVNTETTSSTYSFQSSLAGIVECEATAYDLYGNPSSKRTLKVTSENRLLSDFCDSFPNDPACKVTGPGLDWLEILILILLVVALVIMVIVITWTLNEFGLSDWRILVAIVVPIIVLGLIGLVMLYNDYVKT